MTLIISMSLSADSPILKTGQTEQVQLGDDGTYHLGSVRSYSRSADGIVSDHATGLEWQDDYSHNEGVVKEARLWDDALNYCSTLDLNGTDWRLPEKYELLMLTDRGETGSAIDPIFENVVSSYYYWSATEYDANSSFAWKVSFSTGLDSAPLKTDTRYPAYVRCVRGENGVIQSTYTRDDDNETVTDGVSGLQWQDDSSVATQLFDSWNSALEYCENLEHGTYLDWRLPNLNELWSIVDLEEHFPAIDPSFTHTAASQPYCTSTSLATSSQYGWKIHFNYGFNLSPEKNTTCYGRCVRGGDESIEPSVIMYLLD
jgi:hypothetical protein